MEKGTAQEKINMLNKALMEEQNKKLALSMQNKEKLSKSIDDPMKKPELKDEIEQQVKELLKIQKENLQLNQKEQSQTKNLNHGR